MSMRKTIVENWDLVKNTGLSLLFSFNSVSQKEEITLVSHNVVNECFLGCHLKERSVDGKIIDKMQGTIESLEHLLFLH